MALRENQVYQIGLIISVMLMVCLAVLAFWGFSSSNQATEENITLKTQLQEAQNVQRSAESAVDAMEIMVGTQSGDLDTMMGLVVDQEISKQVQKVREAFEQDLQVYSSNTDDPNNRSWRGLVQNLMVSLTTKMNDLKTAQGNVRQANTEKDTKVKEANDRASALDAEVKKLNNELKDAIAMNEQIRAEFTAKLDEVSQSHATGVEQYTTQIATLQSQANTLQQEIDSKTRTLLSKLEELKRFQRTKFPVADGRIVDVSPSMDRVYVNLGFDDGLQRRVSFSVFGRGVQLEAGLEKAAVEITRILGPHQSEARIIRSTERDPILPNDSIVTASWDPGYEVPVAIAGTVDIDGDGKSDLDRLKALVRKNQGVLAAVADEEGNVEGDINPDVRFLIIGDEPEGEKQRQALSSMIKKADRYYVQQISVREFLHLNGYTPEPSIQSVDVQQNNGFVPRRPPAGASAFDR